MTDEQANNLHASWLAVESGQRSLPEHMGEEIKVWRRDGGEDVLFPPGWTPPEEREKAKAQGAA